MAAKYESKIGQIPYNDQVVYAVLSNLNNLQRFTDAIPKDKVKELEITTDAIRMKIDGLAQKFTIRIVLDSTGKALNNDKINKFNYHLLKLCSELNIPFLNTAEALKDANGQGKAEYFRTSGNENGVHLTQAGNKVAMDYFKTHVYEN